MNDHHPFETTAPSVGACPACGKDVFADYRYCRGCGSAVSIGQEAELLAELQQATLGEFEIRGILGRGGMGLVYLARDLSLDRKVAIKVLPPYLLQGVAAVERFRREARIAGSLRHRHITSIHGLRETTRLVFFVMEYVEGRSLHDVLQGESRLEIDAVAALVHDAAAALAYAHRRAVVHRDVKPGNILIDVEGMAMVTDFGIAKISAATGLTVAGTTVGSPKYMSPEQWSGIATSASDQYALGCVAYQLLAGVAPFDGDTPQELMGRHLSFVPRPVQHLRPDCPPALAAGVMRMLEKEPGGRFASLEDAASAMVLRPVGPDEPVRRRLSQLAKRGQNVGVLPPTPRSPIPIERRRAPADARLERLTRFGRRAAWSAAAVVTLAAGANILAHRPALSPRPSDTAKVAVAEPNEPPPAPPPIPVGAPAAHQRADGERGETMPHVHGRRRTTASPPVVPPAPAGSAVVQFLITPWASLSVDGVPRGPHTRALDTLAAGVPHHLRFERDGFATVDTTLTLHPDEQRLVRIQLLPRQP